MKRVPRKNLAVAAPEAAAVIAAVEDLIVAAEAVGVDTKII
jgi:hypothetical protein